VRDGAGVRDDEQVPLWEWARDGDPARARGGSGGAIGGGVPGDDGAPQAGDVGGEGGAGGAGGEPGDEFGARGGGGDRQALPLPHRAAVERGHELHAGGG